MLIIQFLQGRSRQQNSQNPQIQEPSKGRFIAGQIHKTIQHFFPDLFSRIERITDPRQRRDYSVSELVMAAIGMFILRQGSRNEMNLSRKEQRFRRNYQQLFKVRLPHMDTVDALLRELDEKELERLKTSLVSALIEKKVLNKWRLLGRSYVISVDATHVSTYQSDYCGECTWKTVNKGKNGERRVYFHYVLEAKLVTSSGLSISVGTEWIANSGKEYDKQDCELRAFARLAAKLKASFPRLPICITGDGLYPNATVFGICEQYGWDYIITFKDTCLTSVWEEIGLLPEGVKMKSRKQIADKSTLTTKSYQWINGLEYGKSTLNWVEACIETTQIRTGEIQTTRFVHITNLPLESINIAEISEAGRMRWKIENEGFNAQKNQGYELGHKFSEVSYPALKNYYQCMQIAHMINQFVQHSTTVADLQKQCKTLTIKFLWRRLISFLDDGLLESLQKRRSQIRLA
jgi:hypothetical protein